MSLLQNTLFNIHDHKGLGKNNKDFQKTEMALEGELSFSQFIVLMSTINSEKDSPLGQTVLPPEPFPFFENPRYFFPTLYR